MQIDVHASLAQLVRPHRRNSFEQAVARHRQHGDRFSTITSFREVALHFVVVTRTGQRLDPGLVRHRRSWAEQPDPVVPGRAVATGNRVHHIGLTNGAQQGAPNRGVIEGRIKLVEAHDRDRSEGIPDLDRYASIARHERNLVSGHEVQPIDLTL